MWKAKIPLWVVHSQAAVFLLSFLRWLLWCLSSVDTQDPTVQLKTGWPLGNNKRDGWQCCYSWLLTTTSLVKPAFPRALAKSEENVRGNIAFWIQQDNWTDFGDTGAHSAPSLTFDVCHFDIHRSVCSQSIWCQNTVSWSAHSPWSCHQQGHSYDNSYHSSSFSSIFFAYRAWHLNASCPDPNDASQHISILCMNFTSLLSCIVLSSI